MKKSLFSLTEHDEESCVLEYRGEVSACVFEGRVELLSVSFPIHEAVTFLSDKKSACSRKLRSKLESLTIGGFRE